MRVVVTGATGFVGRAVCTALHRGGTTVVCAVRGPDAVLPAWAERAPVVDLGPETEWSEVLAGADCVVHLAARVHQMREQAADPLAEHRRLNRDATRQLALSCAAAGVRRLVFMSSVKVMGEEREVPYSQGDAPAPVDPYGLSKWEAEQALAAVARERGLEVAILRPPLVYGPGVRANFLQLLRLVRRGIPLPFGGIRNRRSLVFVENLASAVVAAAQSPSAAGRTWFVSDGQDLSTPELVRALAHALGRPARLLPVPASLLRAGLSLVGKGAAAQRLLGSLAVDSGPIRRELGWTPPFEVEAGLAATAEWYLSARGRESSP